MMYVSNPNLAEFVVQHFLQMQQGIENLVIDAA